MRLALDMSLSGRAAGGGSPALTYVKSANLAYLWDADAIVATDGQSLASWTDTISGLSTAGTPSGQPTYKANAIGGKPAVHFAGSQWFDLGRPAALMSLVGTGDFTAMIVCSNLLAGANALASVFGCGDAGGGQWFVASLANVGRYQGETVANPLAANDLYVIFYSVRRSGTFSRVLGGLNGTSFYPQATAPGNGTNNWGIGTGLHDTVANGNTYSFRGDLGKLALWNTNLGFVDIIRQIRKFFTYYGKPMPWANIAKFILGDGDSITEGINGLVNACYPWFSAANLGRKFGEWSNNGRTGATMAQLTADFSFQYAGLSGADALGIPVVCTWMEYANQRTTSGTGPYTNTATYAAQIKAVDPTITSVFMTSTALGGTTAGQGDQTADGALGTNASAQGTYRITYSDFYYNTPDSNMDLVIPLHLDAAIGQIGANPYTPDAANLNFGNNVTHPKGIVGQNPANGYARIAALHSAAIAPLL